MAMDTADSQPELAEIEITPEMIEAGVSVLRSSQYGEDLLVLVSDIFLAMRIEEAAFRPR